MLSRKTPGLRGGGDSCARSRSVRQAELVEFENELLEAIAKMETKELEEVVSEATEESK